MTLEKQGEEGSNRREVEILGEKYEVFDIFLLSADLVEQGDRVYINTKNGNRFMLRRSRSNGGTLTMYSDKDGFSSGHSLQNQDGLIANVGESIKMPLIVDDSDSIVQELTTTEVIGIELKKGVDDALSSLEDSLKSVNVASMLKNRGGVR